MKIGQLAAATASSIETIRFYEREGLLQAPARTSGNYRDYDDGHVRRLAFIRQCRQLDMALDEIRVLLTFKDRPTGDCGAVNQLLDEHIGHVSTRIAQLKALERELNALRQQCGSAANGPDCGILVGLERSIAAEKEENKSEPRAGSKGHRHLKGAH